MRRYDMLPSYHFEDSVNGIIEKPAESDMRDYVIEGNCGKNLLPVTTDIIRDSPLKPGESISCRADNLPSVTLKKNVTNTVKVDTEIQPKSLKCQYYTY